MPATESTWYNMPFMHRVFAVSGVVKDMGLIAATTRGANVRSDIVDAVREAFRTAEADGHCDEDMAAVVHAFRPAT